MRMAAYIAAMLAAAYTGGCALDAGGVNPPCKSCMVAPAKLEDVRPGEDAVALLAAQRAQYAKVAARLRALQQYARTVSK